MCCTSTVALFSLVFYSTVHRIATWRDDEIVPVALQMLKQGVEFRDLDTGIRQPVHLYLNSWASMLVLIIFLTSVNTATIACQQNHEAPAYPRPYAIAAVFTNARRLRTFFRNSAYHNVRRIATQEPSIFWVYQVTQLGLQDLQKKLERHT